MTYSNSLFIFLQKAGEGFPTWTLLSQVELAGKKSSLFACYGNDGSFSKVIAPRVIAPL